MSGEEGRERGGKEGEREEGEGGREEGREEVGRDSEGRGKRKERRKEESTTFLKTFGESTEIRTMCINSCPFCNHFTHEHHYHVSREVNWSRVHLVLTGTVHIYHPTFVHNMTRHFAIH